MSCQLTTAEQIPLPEFAHVPGQNARHAEGFLDHVVEQAQPKTLDAGASTNVAWLYGLRLLKKNYFWEAHEVLEKVWMNALPNSRERHLVQGVIHIANAALKVRMGRQGAARRLVGLAQTSIREAFAGAEQKTLMGLERDQLTEWIASYGAGLPLDDG